MTTLKKRTKKAIARYEDSQESPLDCCEIARAMHSALTENITGGEIVVETIVELEDFLRQISKKVPIAHRLSVVFDSETQALIFLVTTKEANAALEIVAHDLARLRMPLHAAVETIGGRLGNAIRQQRREDRKRAYGGNVSVLRGIIDRGMETKAIVGYAD